MKITFILLLTLAVTIASPAQVPLVQRGTAREMRSYIDSLQQLQYRKAGEEESIIVEFAEEPMFIARRRSAGLRNSVAPDMYLSRIAQFTADAGNLSRSLSPTQSERVKIRRQYYKAFFGVSMTVPSEMLPMLQHLAYVKAIHADREVSATVEPAIELIGAPAVWETLGTQADGVRVGIIDSGVDYLHPALGGGFGPGFKVAGGYDLVNDDGDPMDDNGHGTHVAGIVGANLDTVKGVAPGSILYAYKALNSAGKGSDSDILEAIELTVDPDQNGDDADRLDVVNMSLGNDSGTPTDPTSIAVDNATKLGVVFCIAAGNTGGRTPVQGKEENYFYDGSATIGSPGTAELAITVGASDMSDHLARFSSKGPNRISFGIKPEVVAPGVNINSTFLSSGFQVLSGTSMATPMVAGVAALIRHIHPAWNPAMVKSAIVNKAIDLGLSAYLQGGGRVRALDAALSKTLVVPSTLSYGLDDPAAASWTARETLFVYNRHVAAQSYAAVTAGASAGVSLNVFPSFFTIPAGDSLAVIVALSVNNAIVVNEEQNILRFTGSVSFLGGVDTARVPWAFVRTSRLVITTSEPNAFFLGYSSGATILSTDRFTVTWTSPTRAEAYALLSGTYEFFSLFRHTADASRIVLDEGVAISESTASLFLNGALAVHPLVYRGVDHAGNLLGLYRAPQRSLITSLPHFGDWVTTFPGGSDTVLLSAASGAHSFKPVEFQIDLVDTKTMHTVQFDRFSGMNGPRTLTNSPSNYLQEHFRVKVPPGTLSAANIAQVWAYTDANGNGLFGGVGGDLDTVAVVGDEYSFDGYFSKSPSLTEDLAARFYTSYSDVPALSLDYESPFIMPYHDSIVATPRELVTPAIPRFESGATMTLGGPPTYVMALWYNNTFGPNTLHFQTLFRGMLRENRYGDIAAGAYTVYDKTGEMLFAKSLGEPRQPLELLGDTYKVVVSSSNYWLRRAKGTVTLASEFNLGAGFSANPPSITSFMLLDSARRTTDSFSQGERGTLQFAVNVVNFSTNVLPLFDSTRAWYREHGTTAWLPLVLTLVASRVADEGLIVESDLGAATATDGIAIDLRVASKDASGFSVDQVVSPAFAVGAWDSVATSVPDAEEAPARFALEPNYPNPFNPTTTFRYEIPSSGRVELKVYDVLGREIATLVNRDEEAGRHSIEWDAATKPSGVYFCRLRSGSFIATMKILLLR